MGKVLRIDLSTREVSLYPWTDNDRQKYLGGKIMAARILYDSVPRGVDPFSPDNWLVVTTGPLSGTGAPSSNRFDVSTVSPLTGWLTSSNCGGSFGLALKKAGYDGLIITGKSEHPVWIDIRDDDVVFHEADTIWGKTTGVTVRALPAAQGSLAIGPAGETLVRYAAIMSGERAAGRAGVGAVMGSKNLKAVTASGTHRVAVSDRQRTRQVVKDWTDALRVNPITGSQLPRLGTAGLLAPMHAHGMLATRNYSRGRFERFEEISGEVLAEKHLVKNKGCIGCPIQCGRLVTVDGKQVKGPELETLVLLGSNIENSSLEDIIRWNYLLDELGMDTISTANTIAFAMELNERGLWDNGLRFGETDKLEKVLVEIAYRRGIGDLLAEGTKRLSERFGGEDFAMHSKGLELSAYEPRRSVGMGLGYAVSNRGACHLNGGYMSVLEGLTLNVDASTPKAKPELTVASQDLLEAVSAGGSCLFTAFAAIPAGLLNNPNGRVTATANRAIVHAGRSMARVTRHPRVMAPFSVRAFHHVRALEAVTGMKFSLGRMLEIGERGYNLERQFNVERGLTAADDSLPNRLTHEPQDANDPSTVVPLAQMKRRYYAVRQWDREGRPTQRVLRRLGLCEEPKK
jgi:aldehyde:ferredoxin oxidoreductase